MTIKKQLRYLSKMAKDADIYMRNFATMNGWTHPHVLSMQDQIKQLWAKYDLIKASAK